MSSTVQGNWSATALFWKPQVALLVNQRTLLPVFMPLAPAAMLVTRIPDAIATALRNQGATEEFVAVELAAMSEVRIATTNARRTLGMMIEFAFHGELRSQEGLADLEVLSFRQSSLILGPLHHRHGSPDHELAAPLRSGPSNVVGPNTCMTAMFRTHLSGHSSRHEFRRSRPGAGPPRRRASISEGRHSPPFGPSAAGLLQTSDLRPHRPPRDLRRT